MHDHFDGSGWRGIAALLPILPRHTTPDRSRFLVWDGFGIAEVLSVPCSTPATPASTIPRARAWT
jgi:hypothetical protein